MKTLQLTDASIGFPSRRKAPHVLASGIHARLVPGELTCLVGRNGMGKSTLLKALSGFMPLLRGSVDVVDQAETAGASPVEECCVALSALSMAERARLVSVVLTDNRQAQGLTVGEMVALGRSPYTNFWGTLGDADRQIVARAMALTAISHLSGRRIETLSDGERQKTMIAKALAQQTPIILLDEPTAFLDYPSKVDTLTLLARLAHDEGKAVVFSSHDLELVMRHADTLWLLDGGSMSVGTVAQLQPLVADRLKVDMENNK